MKAYDSVKYHLYFMNKVFGSSLGYEGNKAVDDKWDFGLDQKHVCSKHLYNQLQL